jgi:hypothetical protein
MISKRKVNETCYLQSILVDVVISSNLPHGYDMLVLHCNPFHDAMEAHEAHLHLARKHNLSQDEGPAIKTAATLPVHKI